MVWVQIPSREEQQFDSSKNLILTLFGLFSDVYIYIYIYIYITVLDLIHATQKYHQVAKLIVLYKLSQAI